MTASFSFKVKVLKVSVKVNHLTFNICVKKVIFTNNWTFSKGLIEGCHLNIVDRDTWIYLICLYIKAKSKVEHFVSLEHPKSVVSTETTQVETEREPNAKR